MADNNIGKPLTMVEKVTEPDSNANIFINDNGKVHQAAVNDVLKNSDINTSLEDVKNTLNIQDISNTITKSEFVSTLVLKKQGNHVFGYVRYKNVPPQTPLLDNLPKTLTLHFYSVFEYNTGYPVSASLWQSTNQVIAYGEQSTSEYGGFIDYICVN